MSLPATKYPTNMRVVTGTPTIYNDDVVLLCDTSAGAVTINLLDIPNGYWSTQYKLYVIDNSNNAGTNNITINAGNGQTINNASSVVISSDGGQYLVRISSNTSYIGEYNGCCAGALGFHLVTNAQLLTAISGSTLIQGDFYLVTDVSNADTYVLLQALTINAIDQYGSGYFLNADYQAVGDYSGQPTFLSNLGIWYASLSVSLGSVVIWNNRQYINTTGSNGASNPTIDTTNWTILSKGITNGYILEVDLVIYDVDNNIVRKRWDIRNNEVELYDNGGSRITLNDFQFGRDAVTYNKVLGQSIWNCANSPAQFTANYLNSGTLTDPTDAQFTTGTFISNEISNGSSLIVSTYNKGNFLYNSIKNGSAFSVNQVYASQNLSNNFLESGGAVTITGAVIRGTFDKNTISSQGYWLIETIQNNAIVRGNKAETQGGFQFSAINSDITNCTSENSNLVYIITLNTGLANRCVRTGYSNYELNLDLSSGTIYSGTTLTIPATASTYVGIFNIVNGNANTISSIVNAPSNWEFILQPADTTWRYVPVAIAGAVANNIVISHASFSGGYGTITYRANGNDYVKFIRRGNIIGTTEINSWS